MLGKASSESKAVSVVSIPYALCLVARCSCRTPVKIVQRSRSLLPRPGLLQNVHQAGFVATQQQLAAAQASGCLTLLYSPHWAYHEIEAADTQLYFQCGLMKVVPLQVGGGGLVQWGG